MPIPVAVLLPKVQPRRTLLDSLVSYWKLEEASGNRVDAFGANHLVPNGTPGNAAGKLGSALALVAASSQSVGIASNASLQTADSSFTFSLWVYLADNTAYRFLVAKDGAVTVAGDREYSIHYAPAAVDRFRFSVFRATDTAVTVVANTLGSPALNTWYHIVAWHDSVADTLNISVNGGAADSIATGGALQAASNATFYLGRRASASSPYYHDGRIDGVGFWKRVLTDSERAYLYNGGAGREFPF